MHPCCRAGLLHNARIVLTVFSPPAQVLRVTSGQAEALLDMRKKHLRNLHALYEDRQRLNLQVRLRPQRCCTPRSRAPVLHPVPDACGTPCISLRWLSISHAVVITLTLSHALQSPVCSKHALTLYFPFLSPSRPAA